MLLGLVAAFFVLGVPAVAIAALVMVLRLRREVRGLAAALNAFVAARAPEPEAELAGAGAEEPAAPAVAASAPAATERPPLEERLTQRWLVWLGGVALALGGAFVVKHVADMGLLGPGVRIALAVFLGLALVAAGEWLRLRPTIPAWDAQRPSYVPPALAAGGLVTLFAAFYAAHALYDLLPPLVTFVLLALVAAAGIAIAWWQGPFLAILGVLGGFLAPALVSTESPSALGLFTYLPVLVALAVGVRRYRAWPWLGGLTLAGALLWPLAWIGELWQPGDAPALGLHLVAVLALFTLVPLAAQPRPQTRSRLRHLWAGPELLPAVAALGTALLALILADVDGHGAGSLAAVAALILFALAAAYRLPRLDLLPLPFAAAALLVLASWPVWQVVVGPGQLGDPGVALPPPQPLPEGLRGFVVAAWATAAAFGAAGLLALFRAPRPGVWAGLGAIVPVLVLAVAYGVIAGFQLHLGWATLALALAGLLLLVAERLARRLDRPRLDGALAAYALGVVAALALAATMALEQAWLTVALALQLPAIAWIELRLRLPALRVVAFVLAAIVVARLALNPYLLDYPLGGVPGLAWMLYGYGIPLVAFLAAAHLFRRTADDRLVLLLESGALLFWVLLVSLEIRHIVHAGGLHAGGYPFAERSPQSVAWLASAYGLHRQHARSSRLVPLWGFRLLAGLAALQIVLLQVVLLNPLFTGEPVGRWPLVNLLLPAYAIPAALALLMARDAARHDGTVIVRLAGALGVGLAFVWLSLEVRHAFQGSELDGRTSEAEWYAYSVAWLAFAGVLLLLGILRHRLPLRHASLAIVLATVVKVFVFDLAALEGLWRAGSFIALGLALVAIGLLYQRFVFPPPQVPPVARA